MGWHALGSVDDRWQLWAQLDAHRVTLGLTQDALRRLYLHLLLTRLTDQRLDQLRARGVIPGGPSCRQHEAAQIGSIEPLLVGQDYILPYYRDLGVMLALGLSPTAILLNHLGRADDPISGGRMRPAQWNDRARHVVSASGLVGTQTLHAAGIAFAAKLRGEASVAITFFGEGATSEGDFHEALNFAGLHRLGVIFVCENNGIALSTPQARQMASPYVADRAVGYGMPGVVVDGTNLLAIITAAREAFARARRGDGPTLIEVIIPRHADALRSRINPTESGVRVLTLEDADGTSGRQSDDEDDMTDPVMLFRAYLLAREDLTPELDRRFRAQMTSELDEAERIALAAGAPDPMTDVLDDLLTEPGRDQRWHPVP